MQRFAIYYWHVQSTTGAEAAVSCCCSPEAVYRFARQGIVTMAARLSAQRNTANTAKYDKVS
jgi:hypothetical protein